MNKRILAVARKNFKEKFIGFFPKAKVPGLPKNHILRVIVLLISYIFLIAMAFFITTMLGLIFLVTREGQEANYFAFSSVFIILMLLIFPIFEIVSDFYLSKENEILLSMPIKEDEIFIGKFLGNITTNVDYLIFLIVIMFVYFMNRSLDIAKILIAIPSYISVIIIAYSFSALLVMLVMRFTNARKYGNVFKFIGYGLGVAIFGVYYFYIFQASDIDFQSVLENITSIGANITTIIYPSKLFGDAVANNNLSSVALLILIAAVMLFLVKFISSKIYYDSIIEKQDNSSKKRKKSSSKVQDFKVQSQIISIAKKELTSIIQNPVFLFQSALLVVMIIAITLSLGRQFDVNELIEYFSKSEFIILFLGVGIVSGQFIFSDSSLAFTSLSREGKSFYLIQTLPIDPSANLIGRALGIMCINLFSAILISLSLVFTIKISFLQAILLVVGMMAGAIYSAFFGLFWGTNKINIKWDKPAEVTRTGIFGFIMVIVSYLISAVMYGLSFGIYFFSKNLIAAILLAFVLMLIAGLVFYLLGVEKYKKGFLDVD